MPEMHLRQPGFTYSACRTFNKNKEWIQKFKETGDSRYICQNDRVKYLPRNYMIKHLTLLKIQNMIDIHVDCFNALQIFLIKSILVVVLQMHGHRH